MGKRIDLVCTILLTTGQEFAALTKELNLCREQLLEREERNCGAEGGAEQYKGEGVLGAGLKLRMGGALGVQPDPSFYTFSCLPFFFLLPTTWAVSSGPSFLHVPPLHSSRSHFHQHHFFLTLPPPRPVIPLFPGPVSPHLFTRFHFFPVSAPV